MDFVSGCMSLYSMLISEILSINIFWFILCALLLAVVYGLWLMVICVNKK